MSDMTPQKPTQAIASNDVSIVKQVGEYIEAKRSDIMRRVGGDEDRYMLEIANFKMMISQNEGLQKCSPESLLVAFANAMTDGVSFNPSDNQVYLIPYGKTAEYRLSPYGLVQYMCNKGVIKSYTNPEFVYEGEIANIVEKDGRRMIDHSFSLGDRSDKKINEVLAAYMYVYLSDGKPLLFAYTRADFAEWKKANSNDASRAMSSKGMLRAKVIKHTMKKLPNLPTDVLSKINNTEEEFETLNID